MAANIKSYTKEPRSIMLTARITDTTDKIIKQKARSMQKAKGKEVTLSDALEEIIRFYHLYSNSILE